MLAALVGRHRCGIGRTRLGWRTHGDGPARAFTPRHPSPTRVRKKALDPFYQGAMQAQRNEDRTGAMTQTQAAFPSPPAETKGFAGAITLFVQMMVWVVARAAAGVAMEGFSETVRGFSRHNWASFEEGWAWTAGWEDSTDDESGRAIAPNRSWLRALARLHRDAWVLREAGSMRKDNSPCLPMYRADRVPASRPFATAGPFRNFGGETPSLRVPLLLLYHNE